jgi:hypothetical protein
MHLSLVPCFTARTVPSSPTWVHLHNPSPTWMTESHVNRDENRQLSQWNLICMIFTTVAVQKGASQQVKLLKYLWAKLDKAELSSDTPKNKGNSIPEKIKANREITGNSITQESQEIPGSV